MRCDVFFTGRRCVFGGGIDVKKAKGTPVRFARIEGSSSVASLSLQVFHFAINRNTVSVPSSKGSFVFMAAAGSSSRFLRSIPSLLAVVPRESRSLWLHICKMVITRYSSVHVLLCHAVPLLLFFSSFW